MRIAAVATVAILSFLFIADPIALAEVTDSSPCGFTVEIEVPIAAPPQKVYDQLVGQIDKWWDSAHTYSGDSSNLYLQAAPKGWFGERLPEGGSVQHMEVVFVAPGKVLRLRGRSDRCKSTPSRAV